MSPGSIELSSITFDRCSLFESTLWIVILVFWQVDDLQQRLQMWVSSQSGYLFVHLSVEPFHFLISALQRADLLQVAH